MQSETLGKKTIRNVSQNVARAGETYLGLPGGMKKAYTQTRDMISSYFGLPNLKEREEQALGKPSKGGYEELIMSPPSANELKETATKKIAKKITGDEEYLEPKNTLEKAVGELTQDITSFFMPGTGQLRFAVRLGAPIAGNLTKHGVQFFGGSEETAEKAKLGIMLATTLAGQSNPGQFASDRIGQAKQMIPDTATVDAMPLANRLMPLYQRMTRGLGVPSKSRAIEGMRDLAGQVQGNRISLRSLMDARDNVNEWISEAGGWEIPVPVRDATVRNLNELKTQIIRTIDQNMAARFPQAGELYRTGYEAAAVNHQSNAISNFIERNFGRKVSSVGAKLLFPALAGSASILPKTALGGAALYPIYKTGQVLYRVGNSPTLGRYYNDVIQASLRGNAPAMISSMNKFDKAMAEEEKKDKKRDRGISLEEFKMRFKNMD